MPMTLGPAANLYAEFSFTAGVAAVMAVVRSRYGQVTESRLPSARSVRRHFIVLRNEGAQRFESARQSPRTKETRLGGDQTPSSPEEAALLRGGLEGRGPRASSELIHCGRPPAHHGCAANDCRSVDELTGGGFAVTIIRGLSGGGSRCGRHQLVVARRRCLRWVRPLARGRSAFYVLLKRHRSERGGRARGVIARATSMAGVA